MHVRRFFPLFLVATATLAVATLVSWQVELPSDVAYYAQWSRYPQPAYLDHPGGVAWVLALFSTETLFSAVRWVPLFVALANAVVAALLLARVRASVSGAVAAFAAPAWFGLALLWTPDGGLLLFWHLCVLVLATRRAMWLLPLLVIAMTCFKIVGILLVLVLILVCWTDDERRGWTLIAGLAAGLTLVFTGLPSVAFQLAHRGDGLAVRWGAPIETLLAQVALLGPALFVMVAFGFRTWWRHRHAIRTAGDDATEMLARTGGILVGLLVLGSLFVRVEANWLAPAHLPLIVMTAAVFRPRRTGSERGTESPKRAHGWLRGSWLRGWPAVARAQVAFTGLLLIQLVFAPVPLGAKDPLARLRGWSAWAEQLPSAPLVLSDRYQWHAQIFAHTLTPGATFDAISSGNALRPSALDNVVKLDVEQVLLVWTDVAPNHEVRGRWPVLCASGAIAQSPPMKADTEWELRAVSAAGCPGAD